MRRPRAFTVVEVVLALALLSVLGVSLGSFVSGVRDVSGRLERESARSRAVGVAFERLSGAVRLAEAAGVGERGGVSGDGRSVSVAWRTVTPSGGSDLAVLTFAFEDGVVRVAVRDGRSGDASLGESIAVDAHRVRVRYHDGEAWRDLFDSRRAGRLPAAIEVSVWFGEAPEDADDAALDQRAPDRRRVFAVGDARGEGAS